MSYGPQAQGSSWSQWIWSTEYEQYYCERWTSDGQREVHWQSSDSSPRASRHAFSDGTRNSTATLDDSLNAAIETLSLDPRRSYHEPENSAYTHTASSNTPFPSQYEGLQPNQLMYGDHQAVGRNYSGYGGSTATSTSTNVAPNLAGPGHLQSKSQNPQSHSQSAYHLKTRLDGNDFEQLDPSFKRVRTEMIERFFRVGRVFAVLWVEPSSASGGEGFSLQRFGQGSFAEIRRFIVVVNQGDFHSLCVPIVSYRGKGASGRPDQEHHAIVYMGSTAPAARRDEKLNKHAIKIEPRGNETLTKNSRINFSKIYTVEHNLKVKAIGEVPQDHMAWVSYYFRESTTGTAAIPRPTTYPTAGDREEDDDEEEEEEEEQGPHYGY